MMRFLLRSFRALTRQTERTLEPADLGLERVGPFRYISEDSRWKRQQAIFLKILEGKGSRAQNDVVVANAALALYCMDED